MPDGGSLARDHLANERTYLAWVRTGLGSAAVGAAVAELGDGNGLRARVAGALFLAIGLVALAYGTSRYYRVQRALGAGRLSVDVRGPLVLSAIAVAVAVAAGVLLLL